MSEFSDNLPYTVVGGVPAKIIAKRFNINEAIAHESKIYPLEKRLSKKQLIHLK